MTLYEKIQELEKEIELKGAIVFNTPYKKIRTILGIENGKIKYSHTTGRISEFDIDLFYRDYLLLKDLGFLTSDMIKAFNKRFKNGNKPCNATTFMLLMEKFYGCKFIRGKNGEQSIIYW
ncbi:MAG: hypothetical protein IKA85_08520 [Clostridia bacterium]|nr:hypothetical protein [Clostridia bacterium]MBR2377793.1 hypothetical protein [Clostridia bacterium]